MSRSIRSLIIIAALVIIIVVVGLGSLYFFDVGPLVRGR